MNDVTPDTSGFPDGAPSIDAVLYDLDGTVVDTSEVIRGSLRYATRHVLHVIIPDGRLMAKVGQPTEVEMRDFSQDEAQVAQLCESFRYCNGLTHDARIQQFSGMSELLEQVKAWGVPQAIVTSKRRRSALASLGVFGYEKYFDLLVTADDDIAPKPDPAPVLLAARKLGVEPQRCLFVGDSPFDIASGNAAGAATVGVTWGMFSRQITECGADRVVGSCEQLEKLIGGLFGRPSIGRLGHRR